MSEENEEKVSETEEKPGFFKRMVNKLDQSMKEKADEQAEQNDCCSGDDEDSKCC